jgi:hypothetical protein
MNRSVEADSEVEVGNESKKHISTDLNSLYSSGPLQLAEPLYGTIPIHIFALEHLSSSDEQS